MEPWLLGLTLTDIAVIAGVALVFPAALGGRWRWWTVVAGTTAASCWSDQGSALALLLALPWLCAASLVAIGAADDVRRVRTRWPSIPVRLLASIYGTTAAAWFALSRAGVAPMGIEEPIVQLTAVHFTYVGLGALSLAASTIATAGGTTSRTIGRSALLLVAGAPPVVAVGFVSGAALPQVGGAVLLTIGVWLTGALQLWRAGTGRADGLTRVFLTVSGLAVWVPMVLAVAWAAGQHWDVPILSIPDMVRTHGAANAVGFVGAGLLAIRLEHRVLTTWQ